MRELTINEITSVHGGCQCYCKDEKGRCVDVGAASSLTECANVCGGRLCFCK